MTVTDDRPAAVLGSRLLRREDPALLTGEAKFTNDLHLPGALHLAVAAQPVRARPHPQRRPRARRACRARCRRRVQRGRPDRPVGSADAVCVAGHRRHEEPRPLPARQSARPATWATAWRACWPPATTAARDALELIDVQYEPLAGRGRPGGRAQRSRGHPRRPRHQQQLHVGPQDRGPRGPVEQAFASAAYTVNERYVQQRLIPMAMEPACGRRRAAAVRRRHHPLHRHADPAHPQGHDAPHARHPRAPAARHRPGGRRRLRQQAQRVRRGAAVRGARPQAPRAGALERGARRERRRHHPRPRPDPAHRARRRRRRQAHRRPGAHPRPTWAPTCSSSRRASRSSGAFLYAGVYDLPTPTTSAARACSPRSRPPTPTAAPADPRPPTPSSGRWTRSPHQMGIDPMELRRRNFIQKEQFPYTAFTGLVYDSRRPLAAAEKAAEMADYDGVRARQTDPERAGRARSASASALASYFEMCGLAPSRVLASLNYSAGGWESATVRVLPTNKIQVVTGTSPHGQGHETSWSMIVAEKLGVATRRRRRAAQRHRARAARARHLRLALAAGRRRRHRHGVRQGHRQGEEDRRPPAGGQRGRPRVRRRRVHREGLARSHDAAGRDRLRGVHRPQPARRARAQPRGPGHLRPAELLVAVRHPHLHGRGRHRDRPGRRAAVRRRRRLRQPGEPAHRRGPGARRRHPGPRPGAVRGGRATTPTATCKNAIAGRIPRAGGQRRTRRSPSATPSPRRPPTSWA